MGKIYAGCSEERKQPDGLAIDARAMQAPVSVCATNDFERKL
jgi:hypothetical protein